MPPDGSVSSSELDFQRRKREIIKRAARADWLFLRGPWPHEAYHSPHK